MTDTPDPLREALDGVMAAVRLDLMRGDTEQRYSAIEVAVMVRQACEQTWLALARLTPPTPARCSAELTSLYNGMQEAAIYGGDVTLTLDAANILWPVLARHAALVAAARPILDRCLDFFGPDDLDPGSSEAMPVVIKNRWVYALRAALADEPQDRGDVLPPSNPSLMGDIQKGRGR